MNQSFGARLRLQREQRCVALTDVSNQTKIKLSLLEALERDDLTWWPHGIFGRAYIRAYAQAFRADPEPIIREFLEVHPDPVDEFAVPDNGGSNRLSNALGSAIGAIPALLRRTDKADRTHRTDRTDRSEKTAKRVPVEHAAEAPAAIVAAPEEPPVAPHVDTGVATVAGLCMRLQHAEGPHELEPILADVARAIDATGLVLWSWDAAAAALKPWLTYGYAGHVVAQFPWVRRDEDNAIAASFRSISTTTVDRGLGDTGAFVVPLVVSNRCLGALSLELRNGDEHRPHVTDVAVIVAALLAGFMDVMPLAAVVNG